MNLYDFVDNQQSAETRRAYARDISVYTRFMDELGGFVDEPSESDLIAFRDALVERFSPNGAARVWNTVRGLYRFNRSDTHAFEHIKPPKRNVNVTPHIPTDEEVSALVAEAQKNPQRALIIALLLNGLRATEVATLEIGDLEEHEGAPILRVLGKGQKERLVPVNDEVVSAYATYREKGTPAQRRSRYLVSGLRGEGLNYRQVEHAVYKTAEYAHVIGMHPHALRHHYATRLIRAGVDALYVQRLLGHSSVATTQVYVGLDLGDLIEAARKDPRNVL